MIHLRRQNFFVPIELHIFRYLNSLQFDKGGVMICKSFVQ